MNNTAFLSRIFEQKRTTEKLIEESQADTDFYLLLSSSVFITTLGLLINNPIVVIGAMLVAPILFPILALGLGVVTSSGEAIRRAISILGRSIGVGVAISFVTAFLIRTNGFTEQLELLVNPDLFIFFLISFAAGIVATFSWVDQKTALSFPGVAITVSLVPPLSAIGTALALLSTELFVGALLLFFVNLLGVVLASIMVFSFFGFSQVRAWQDERIREEAAGSEDEVDSYISDNNPTN